MRNDMNRRWVLNARPEGAALQPDTFRWDEEPISAIGEGEFLVRNLLISFGTPDRLVSHSVGRYRRLLQRPDVTLSAFFAMECPVVEPTMFEALPELQSMFRRTLSWSDTEEPLGCS